METYIKGNYRKSIFKSDKGYVIGLFKVRETNDEKLKDYVNRTITFTGYFYDLNEDDTFIFYGEGVDHPRYGFQFNVSNYEKVNKNRESLIELVKNSTQYANMVVYEKAQSRKELNKMGTTLDVCLIHQNRAFISHIGDSRIYRLRKEFFRRLTKDHSYVQQLVDEGKISKQESLNHPDKNMLMKALGVSSFIEPDAMVKGFLKGDVILMCSDGLSNMVSEKDIVRIIKENPTDATKMLVQTANDNGGRDNITAVLLRSQ